MVAAKNVTRRKQLFYLCACILYLCNNKETAFGHITCSFMTFLPSAVTGILSIGLNAHTYNLHISHRSDFRDLSRIVKLNTC